MIDRIVGGCGTFNLRSVALRVGLIAPRPFAHASGRFKVSAAALWLRKSRVGRPFMSTDSLRTHVKSGNGNIGRVRGVLTGASTSSTTGPIRGSSVAGSGRASSHRRRRSRPCLPHLLRRRHRRRHRPPHRPTRHHRLLTHQAITRRCPSRPSMLNIALTLLWPTTRADPGVRHLCASTRCRRRCTRASPRARRRASACSKRDAAFAAACLPTATGQKIRWIPQIPVLDQPASHGASPRRSLHVLPGGAGSCLSAIAAAMATSAAGRRHDRRARRVRHRHRHRLRRHRRRRLRRPRLRPSAVTRMHRAASFPTTCASTRRPP